MQRITINLMNMYDADPTLLDQLVLPTQLDRDDFIGRLMIDIGESEVCITNPGIMKIAVGVWSRGKLPVWQKLANVLDFEYNPIWNVDGETAHSGSTTGNRSYGRNRTDEETETYTRERNTEEQGTQSTTATGSKSESETRTGTSTDSETTTGQISADNVETWSNDTKTVTEKTGSTSNSGTVETEAEDESQTETSSTAEEQITDNRTRNEEENIADTEQSRGSDSWTEKRTGNIGVTTTQKMMTEEVEFWQKYDIIGYIINQFAAEFCLLVY